MTINFKDPRLQRARQKIAAMNPAQRAIFNASTATASFASNEMAKDLQLTRIGNRLTSRRESFNLRNKIRKRDLSLSKKRYNFEKKQGKTATAISGLGILPTGYLSYKAYKNSGQTAKDIINWSDRIRKSTDKLGG